LNGFFTPRRFQEAQDACPFCGVLDLEHEISNCVEHFTECTAVSAASASLALPSPVGVRQQPRTWFSAWLSGAFGRSELIRFSLRGRRLAFPLFVEALYSIHNSIRHGLDRPPHWSLALAIWEHVRLNFGPGLPRPNAGGAAGPVSLLLEGAHAPTSGQAQGGVGQSPAGE